MKKNVINNYKPLNGFYDLRDFVLSKRMFIKLWVVQDFLFSIEKAKSYYKEMEPGSWQKAKELSARYQQILLSFPLKEK